MADGAAVNLSVRWEVIYCYKCGIGFAVGASIRSDWLDKGTTFYCPNGHNQHYTESNVQKLEKQLAQERKFKEWAQQDARNQAESRRLTERRLKAQRGVATRLRNRIAAGACPCCRQKFPDLKAHMAEKHPDYATKERV